MTPLEARAVLGIEGAYTSEGIQARAREMMRLAHPDNGGDGKGISAVKEARGVLLASLSGENTCKQCNGRGYIKARLGSVECAACSGGS